MKRLTRFAVAALCLVACQGGDAPLAPVPQTEIVDGAHNGGNPGFFFLQPMVPNPNPSGSFDAAVSPIVEICVLTGPACGNSPADLIATFTTTSGPGSETVRVSATDQHYIVNWHTDAFALDLTRHYRIRVLVAGAEVGHADVDLVSTGREVKSVATGEYIPLVDGRTLPIKFRIEAGMAVAIGVSPSSAEVAVGETAVFTATLTDAHGGIVAHLPVSWTSSDAGIASVDGAGTVTGVSSGTATITASAFTLSGSVQVHVFDPCAAPQPMLAFWTFEEGTGTTTEDLSGNNHTGTLHGSPTWVAGAQGVGSGLDFDNATDLVNVGSFLAGGVTALTVGAWVNAASFTNTGDVAAGGISGPRIISATDGGGWSLGHAPGNGKIQVELRAIASFTLDTVFPLNRWAHVALVYDGASVTTYLDGEQVDTRSAPALVVRQASNCTMIGNEPEGCLRQTNGNFAWQGAIDEVVVYGRALTYDEVQAVYRRCFPR